RTVCIPRIAFIIYNELHSTIVPVSIPAKRLGNVVSRAKIRVWTYDCITALTSDISQSHWIALLENISRFICTCVEHLGAMSCNSRSLFRHVMRQRSFALISRG